MTQPNDLLERLRAVEIDEVVGSSISSKMLREMRSQIVGTREILIAAIESNVSEVWPVNQEGLLNDATNFLNEAKNAVGVHKSVTNNPSMPNWQNTLRQIRGSFTSIFQVVSDRYTIPTLVAQMAIRRPTLEQLGRDLTTAREKVKESSDLAETAKVKAREALGALELKAIVGLAGAYNDEVKKMNFRGWVWAGLSIGAIASTVGFLGWFVYLSLSSQTLTLEHSLFRVGVLAIMFGIFHLCLRTQQAYRHLEVVNRHRVNIARSFEKFVDAMPSDAAKDQLAYLAAEHMLVFGRSGLLSRDLSVQTPVSVGRSFASQMFSKKE